MAIIQTAQSGLASATSTWVGGVLPVEGDQVIINQTHTVEIDGTYTWGNDGSSLTSTVLVTTAIANASAVPTFIQISAAPFALSNGSTVKFGSVTVTLAAALALNATSMSVSSISSTIPSGTTSNALPLNNASGVVLIGGIKASRLVNSSLTVKGTIYMEVGSNPVLDYGTIASPIPAGITAELLLNKAATPSVRAGIHMNTQTNISHGWTMTFYGTSSRTRWLPLASGITAGTNTLTLTSAAHGWQIGDEIMVLMSDASKSDHNEFRTISNVSGATITVSSNFTYAHATNIPVSNLKSNVLIRSYSETDNAQATIRFFCSNLYTNFLMYGYDACFRSLGRTTNAGGFTGQAQQIALTPFYFQDCVFDNRTYSTVGTVIYCASATQFYKLVNCVFTPGITSNSPVGLDIDGCVFRNYITTNPGSTIKNSWIALIPSQEGLVLQGTTLDNVVISGGSASGMFNVPTGSPKITIKNSDLGATYNFTPNFDGDYLIRIGGNYNRYHTFEINNCLVGNASAFPEEGQEEVRQIFQEYYYYNKNRVITAQEYWGIAGKVLRDNSNVYRGGSSLQYQTWAYTENLNRPLQQSVSVLAANGETIKCIVYVKIDSTFYNSGACAYPFITVTGNGVNSTFTATAASYNAWEKITVTATNSSGTAGYFTITPSVQINSITSRVASPQVPLGSSAALNYIGGLVLFDGLILTPFTQTVRHYGFLFDNQTKLSTNAYITNTNESSVGAYTGISISSGTITLTQNHTIQELYDYCQWYLCQTANLGVADFFSTSDGKTYTCTYNLVLNNATLSGSGTINMPTNTLTITGTGSTSLVVIDSVGYHVNITVSGITTGSRIQVYNITDNTSIYNGIAASVPILIPIIWSSDKLIRLRVAYTSGLTSQIPQETFTTLTNTGANFTIIPQTDTVYVSNAIDGSTVTEFTADVGNLQIDVSDGDGFTSPQRIYAWYKNLLMSSSGISTYFNAIIAEDQINYRIDVSVVNITIQNVGTNSVNVVGARIYRSDDSTIFVPGNGPIQHDPNKTYLANAESLTASIWTYNTRTVTNPELSNLDATISSRLPTSSYVAPDNTSITAIKSKTDNLPVDPASQSTLVSLQTFVTNKVLTVAKFLGLK